MKNILCPLMFSRILILWLVLGWVLLISHLNCSPPINHIFLPLSLSIRSVCLCLRIKPRAELQSNTKGNTPTHFSSQNPLTHLFLCFCLQLGVFMILVLIDTRYTHNHLPKRSLLIVFGLVERKRRFCKGIMRGKVWKCSMWELHITESVAKEWQL